MQEKKGPNGFLLGLLIGGAIGAFVSTKKGRQILKDIAEYGLDYVGNSITIEDIDTILNSEEEEMINGEMEKEQKVYSKDSDAHEEQSRRRRLFKGIKKK